LKQVAFEAIRQPQRFAAQSITKEELCPVIDYILKQTNRNLHKFVHSFPASASEHGVYPTVDNTGWTPSFWTGILWLAYECTSDEKYRLAAQAQLASYKWRIDEKIDTDTHDLGFLYTLSCVADYKLTQNDQARQTALKAADLLMERYFCKAGIIQAWGNLNDPNNRGRMIIDCCMNLPLLFWASSQTGKASYYSAAYRHLVSSQNYIVREGASTYHTFYMDVETGKPKYGKTHQGYSDNSCWSRGQAWGIYGFALGYRYTGQRQFIELSKKLANYFLNRLPEDSICYWDLIFTSGLYERDSSAAAIAACGLLELAGHLPISDPDKCLYEGAAIRIIKSLCEGYLTTSCPKSDGLLLHGVYSKPRGAGVDECMIWGDYFFFEAAVRLTQSWFSYW
jgi:unsaturated chondroitin disaccharide hydrolase